MTIVQEIDSNKLNDKLIALTRGKSMMSDDAEFVSLDGGDVGSTKDFEDIEIGG